MDTKKMSWIAWKKLSWSKKDGGLGFRDIQCFNDAMLAKLSWRLIENPTGLLARILTGKYCPKESFLTCKPSAACSHGWSSILAGRDLLKEQLGWAIGNGASVNIWRDPWLLTSPIRLPFGPATRETQNLTVSDLFHPTTTDWNVALIEDIFPTHIAEILSLKPSLSGAPDKLIWMGKSTGAYTTKTGYYTALEREKTEDFQQPTPGFSWISDVWQQKTSPKIKLFMWKIAHKSLPVGERLLSRHIPVDPKCKRCGDIETIPHLFFLCAFSQQVWRTTPFVGCLETGEWNEYEQAWTVLKNKIVLPPAGITTGPLAPWILWSLWLCRNKLGFEDKRSTSEEALTTATSSARELIEAQQQPTQPNRKKTPSTNKTTDDILVCQTDAVWSSENQAAGLGWIVKIHGIRNLEQSKIEHHVSSCVMAEALALREAVSNAAEKGFKNEIRVRLISTYQRHQFGIVTPESLWHHRRYQGFCPKLRNSFFRLY